MLLRMRTPYTLLLFLITPFVLLRLWWRGRAQPEYRQRIGERFGWVSPAPQGVAVWLHAVSVGESLAALPLIRALIERHGTGRVWVTTTTPTGSARVQAALGACVRHSYAPYDLPGAVSRFLDRARPEQVVVMETELWPNLFAQLAKRGIPLVIANARLSPRSFRGYGRVAGFTRQVLANVTCVAAQSAADAERFRVLGAPRVENCGNLKFDLDLPTAQIEAGKHLRARIGPTRPVWVAASTHEGEEAVLLDVHRRLRTLLPDALLILVPRHPQRFDTVAKLIADAGLPVARRSLTNPESRLDTAGNDSMSLPADQTLPNPVLLGDSMGEMFVYLAASDVAFVGGSLVPVGGHNVLEPAALGKPVLFGPHMHNFLPARELLLQADAAHEIDAPPALTTRLHALFTQPVVAASMGSRGQAAVAANRGALQMLLSLLWR